jgi:hypothetical protein
LFIWVYYMFSSCEIDCCLLLLFLVIWSLNWGEQDGERWFVDSEKRIRVGIFDRSNYVIV